MEYPSAPIEANSPKVIEKIALILQKFLEPNFKLKSDLYIHEFFGYLVNKHGDEKTIKEPNETQLKEVFYKWLVGFSKKLNENNNWNPPVEIVSFALLLASKLSSDEQTFVKLNCSNIFEILVGFSEAKLSKDQSIKQSFVCLLSSFLEHKSGVQWVISTSFWVNVISIGLKDPVYIRKNAYYFVVKLLEKTISFNRNFSSNLVTLLVKPLKDALQCLSTGESVVRLFKSLKPFLNFLEEVTVVLLKNFNKQLFALFLEVGTLETVEQIHLQTHDDAFCDELIKMRLIFTFYKLCVKVEGAKVVAHDNPFLSELQIILELLKNEILKGNTKCVIKMCNYAHGLYCDLEHRMPLYVKKGEVLKFQNQMILYQIMPMLIFSLRMYPQNMKIVVVNEDFRKDFTQKLVKMVSAKSIELCSRFMVKLELKDDLMDDATLSLKYLLKTKNLLTKETAVTIFQALVFSLEDAVTQIRLETQRELVPRCTPFLGCLMDTLVDLVERFDLTWKDSIEVICVLKLSCDILDYPNWNNKTMIIKGLRLLYTAISRYMSPDMVLLVYSTKDSLISHTGDFLYGKCHDTSWKIRYSALNVVFTIALNANTRFPALTSVLLKAKLPRLVVKMALKDDHSFVRATAFRCIQEMVQIQQIWQVLSDDTFLDIILNVFTIETEGLVRQGAAQLIYKIYKYQRFPDHLKPRLYEVMTHAVIRDAHWEVKYTALNFWCYMWEMHLQNQGMIDRKFPTHTFSMEHKKIVVLNDAEIRKRIIKVLNNLSTTGCLYVVKSAIQDKRDIEVARKAIGLASQLLVMFKRFKVPDEKIDLSDPTCTSLPLTNQLDPLLHETMSLKSWSTMSTLSSSSVGNPEDLDSAEFANSQYFDTFTPHPNHHLLDLDTGTSVLSKDPQITTNRDTPAPLPGQSTSRVLPDPSSTVPTTSQVQLNIDEICDVFDYDMLGESYKNTMIYDRPESTRRALTEAVEKRTQTYLAPSHFLKFVYNELESYQIQHKTKNSLEKFEALLDDILFEYNIDSITID